jgi:catechol 2,3-dioxygenase-like lactoylglutathione lyase family enzyme
MPTELKAVVFRTSKLKETKDFFVAKLGMVIKESSVTHFVIHSKGIRLLFVESDNDLEVELYSSKSVNHSHENNLKLHSGLKIPGLATCKDPNGIKIIISEVSDNSKIKK